MVADPGKFKFLERFIKKKTNVADMELRPDWMQKW